MTTTQYPRMKRADTMDNDDYSGIGYRPNFTLMDMVKERMWNAVINREETCQRAVAINWSGHTKREFAEYLKMEQGEPYDEKLMKGNNVMSMDEYMALPEAKKVIVNDFLHNKCFVKPPQGMLNREQYQKMNAEWEKWQSQGNGFY